MNNTARRAKITVSADGKGIVSHAGALLLLETARVMGLGRGLSAGLAGWRASRAVHDPGKIVTDLVMALALGGDCLADIAVLRAQRAIRRARAAARERAWALAGQRAPGADGSLIPVDIDATIVLAHSPALATPS